MQPHHVNQPPDANRNGSDKPVHQPAQRETLIVRMQGTPPQQSDGITGWQCHVQHISNGQPVNQQSFAGPDSLIRHFIQKVRAIVGRPESPAPILLQDQTRPDEGTDQ